MILPLRVFGSSGVNDDVRRLRDRADLLRDVVAQLLEELDRAGSFPPLSVTKATIAWPVECVSAPAHGRLGDRRVVDEGGLDLDRRDPVAGDVHDVVDAAEQPEVAVRVDARAVAGEVHAVVAATSRSRR